jgi:hypothetical protein
VTTTTSDWPAANTQHGLLVAFGEFLQQHGLIERLMQVPVPQKTRRFSPQTRLAWLNS